MIALFKTKASEQEKEGKKEKKDAKTSNKDASSARLNDIIIAPRITEKTVSLMDKGVYTFDVRKDANKTEVAKAIKLIYNVEPVKVRIINYPEKPKMNHKTGKMGSKKGGKKALVYLKKGEKISVL